MKKTVKMNPETMKAQNEKCNNSTCTCIDCNYASNCSCATCD
ncbi:hypothetical protein [Flavobacterium sp. XGLA_31]